MIKEFLFLVVTAAVNVQAMTVEEYMSTVAKNNKLVSSYDISVEASNERKTAGDLSLSPTLTALYSQATDKSLPSTIADERDTNTYSLGVSKKFSTGTAVSVFANTYDYKFKQPVIAGYADYYKGGVGISLTQSLWKDSFGAATRLRQTRESIVNEYETLGLELQRRSTLVQIESDYWDYLVAQENFKLKEDNLERVKKLQTWTSNRVYNGISDDSDLLQIKALVGIRELNMATAADDLKSREAKVRENLNLADSDPLPPFTSDLTQPRPYFESLVQKKNVTQISTYLTSLDAKIKKTAAEETVDALRPDLSLTGQYSTSSYALDRTEMQNNLGKTDRPVTYIGVNFSWLFGSDAKSAQLSSSKKEAMASQYRAEQAKVAGENAWAEYLRKYELTRQNVLTLEKIAKFQKDRVKSEQTKFSKGRTITTNVVNAEIDSAEADVSYLTAKSTLRKMEAGTQLFISAAE
jgi:outer membrane protein TolC